MRGIAPPRFSRSQHLVDLVAEVERLAARVASAPRQDREQLAAARRADWCRATLMLDGASTEDLPDPDRARAVVAAMASSPGTAPDAERPGTWLDAMGNPSRATDEHLRALESIGVWAGFASDDLAEELFGDPVAALRELHRRLTRGLVSDERAGVERVADQAVHDGSIGRIIYFPTDPAAIAGELALLGAWLASTGTREHGLIASGVLHLELLRIHPFDAANGRLARAAARLVLRARGLDPDGLAAPEPAMARDLLGYHEEVARTLRRRDLTVWLERWGEAVADGLRQSALSLGVLGGASPLPARAAAFVDSAESPAFTIADYRAGAIATPEDARAELQALLDRGRISRVPGSRGLRFTVLDAGAAPDPPERG